MARKFAGRDYVVSKLEGLWWNPEQGGRSAAKKVWNWQLMIRTPDFITPAEVRKTKAALLKKGKPPTITKVNLVKLNEGRCVQMLHVGPYDQEQPTMDAMFAFAAEKGLSVRGKHHEIYLSDPRLVIPSRRLTLLRYSLG